MSEELLPTIIEEDELPALRGEEDSPPKKEKNPNRVKQGFKLAAIGQRAKEEKMRQRVKNEMIRPSTWITIGIIFACIGFAGIYFFPLFIFSKEEEQKFTQKIESPKKENRNYFG